MNNELGLEDEFVTDRLGTVHRAIDVFKTGEFQGKHNEQLRIIKLLETKAEEPCCCFTGTYGEHELSDLIALIKGENK